MVLSMYHFPCAGKNLPRVLLENIRVHAYRYGTCFVTYPMVLYPTTEFTPITNLQKIQTEQPDFPHPTHQQHTTQESPHMHLLPYFHYPQKTPQPMVSPSLFKKAYGSHSTPLPSSSERTPLRSYHQNHTSQQEPLLCRI